VTLLVHLSLRDGENGVATALRALCVYVCLTGERACVLQVEAAEFAQTLELMEKRYGANDFVPEAKIDTLYPGTYYLTKVDDLYRRFYERKSGRTNGVENLANGGGSLLNGH
jgi:hypothetical protein